MIKGEIRMGEIIYLEIWKMRQGLRKLEEEVEFCVSQYHQHLEQSDDGENQLLVETAKKRLEKAIQYAEEERKKIDLIKKKIKKSGL